MVSCLGRHLCSDFTCTRYRFSQPSAYLQAPVPHCSQAPCRDASPWSEPPPFTSLLTQHARAQLLKPSPCMPLLNVFRFLVDGNLVCQCTPTPTSRPQPRTTRTSSGVTFSRPCRDSRAPAAAHLLRDNAKHFVLYSVLFFDTSPFFVHLSSSYYQVRGARSDDERNS